MYLGVKKVKPVEDYKLYLIFENGEERLFDMKPYLDLNIFIELKNLSMFNSVRVSFDTIEWENHADIDPEILYNKSVLVK
jgi:hypothetical protein